MRLQLVSSRPDPPVNVAAAKAAMQRERAEVAQKVGLKFAVIHCPHCGVSFDAVGVSEGAAEGKAINLIVAHVVQCHNGGAA